MNKINIVIFGIGSISKLLTERIKDNVNISAYVAEGEILNEINGIPVIPLNRLKSIDYEYVVVAFGNSNKGIDLLQEIGVPTNRIICYTYCGVTYDQNVVQETCDRYINEKLHNHMITELFDIPEKRLYLCSMNIIENDTIIKRDFVREQTLSLLAKEINRKNVKGAVAEIGVGDFSNKINLVFPDRDMYLFDIFNGITGEDKRKAIELGWGERLYAKGDTSIDVDEKMKTMLFKERCIIKKGYFPDSFDLNIMFAFVSLDIDFYEPTKKGLEKIWPFISKGGYIMAHDFNNLAFEESRKAIEEFCDENNVAYVPIPDNGGTAVIVK